MLFTASLPLGSAPESLMLSVKFVTEAVVQVTTRQNTLTELIRQSQGILTQLCLYRLTFPAQDCTCKSDKLVRAKKCWALICTLGYD